MFYVIKLNLGSNRGRRCKSKNFGNVFAKKVVEKNYP